MCYPDRTLLYRRVSIDMLTDPGTAKGEQVLENGAGTKNYNTLPHPNSISNFNRDVNGTLIFSTYLGPNPGPGETS